LLTDDDVKDWIFDNLPDYVPPPKPKPSIGDFAKFVLPVIRNMPNAGLLDELVAVQPMQLPAGALFYMDFVYSESWWRRWLRNLKKYAHRIYRMRWLPGQAADQARADQRAGGALDHGDQNP
jgi:hypothetical protein